MEYTKEYFIEKFEAISEENWIEGAAGFILHDGKACALGHCGMTLDHTMYYKPSNECIALIKLFGGKFDSDFQAVYRINDNNRIYKGATPKERILNKLKSL